MIITMILIHSSHNCPSYIFMNNMKIFSQKKRSMEPVAITWNIVL